MFSGLTVFWPTDDLRHEGVFFGWIDGRNIVVAGINNDLNNAKVASTLGGCGDTHSDLWRLAGKTPVLLGEVSLSGRKIPSPKFFNHELLRLPHRFVLYNRPQIHKLRFFSIEPLQLDITARSERPKASSPSPGGYNLSSRMTELQLLDPSVCKSVQPQPPLQTTINLLNAAYEVHQVVEHAVLPQSGAGLVKSLSLIRPHLSVYGRNILVAQQWMTRAILLLCNLGFRWSGPQPYLLKDISATVQQIDVRMEQALHLPHQFRLIKKRNRSAIAHSSAQYISFYNFIWLILNDAIVGTALGAFLCQNSSAIGEWLANTSKVWTVEAIQDALVWLDNWPVGLKLNSELSRFFCWSLMSVTELWGRALQILSPHFPSIIYLVGVCGRSGATLILSILSDLLSLLTTHIYISYIASTWVFSSSLSVAGSLWRLFRGKRRNVLRNRTDSWDYELDQLLLGTILFTLLAFLFPTVLVYYTLFAMARMIIIFIHAILETFLAFMNHFPLFATMLRLKDPSRLPGGVYFVLRNSGDGQYMELKNQAISFGRIFFQHLQVWSKVSAHYDPRRLIRCLFTGTVITPIQRYKIRYSMIPDRLASLDTEHSQS